MRKRRPIEVFSISFLDLLSGALGAVIILYVAIPKNQPITAPTAEVVKEIVKEPIKSDIELDKVRAQLAEVTEKLAFIQLEKEAKEAVGAGGKDLDVGFKFKGKEILFIIDTSYSMIEEDRMGQV